MQLVRNRILLAKIETTPGTDSTPTVGSNAVEVMNLKMNLGADVLSRDNIRGNISQVSPVIGKRWGELNFDVELRGSGSVGVASQLSALLQACAMSETVSAGSSVIYLPTSASQKTITMYLYNLDTGSAVLYKFTGVVGDFDIKADAGKFGVVAFKMKGLYTEPTDVALPSTPTYETTIAPSVQNASFSINSISSLIIKSLALNIGNTIADRDDISSPQGLKGFFVSLRKPKGSFNPEAGQVAAYNMWNDWTSSAQRALSVQVGSVAGNIITITAPKVVIDAIKDGDQSGILTYENTFQLGLNTGNDEVQLKFT